MLVGHWPLIGNFNDYSGNNNNLTYQNNNNKIIIEPLGKIGVAYKRAVARDGADWLESNNNVNFQGDFTFAIWAYVSAVHSGTANGLLTNHNHSNNTGAGITVREISSSDYRISCNTGTGSSRTFNAFFGTTNIKDKWSHLVLRFIKETNTFSLWTNGNKELEWNYAQFNVSQRIGLFSWSLGYNNNSDYRPAAIMNDARVYDNALSDYEVKELAKAKFGHWTFDTNNLDSSGYGNNATNIGIISSDNKIGSSSLLVGQNTVSTGITGLIYRESFSASIWFKLIGNDLTQNAGTSRSVFGNWSNYHGFMFYRNNGDSTNRYRFYLNFRTTSDTRGTISREQDLVLNTWYHVAIAGSPTGQYSFVLNGQVVQSGTLPNFKSWEGEFPASQNASFFIGRNNSYNAIEGYVDDCQLYMTYLTPEDYTSIYNRKANFDNLGNVSVYELDENSFSTNYNINDKGQIIALEFDEVTGTQNTNAKQEIKDNGTLFINGEFSEVD
jgi:hypothetical protein